MGGNTKTKTGPRRKNGVVQLGARISPALMDRMRKIAFDSKTSVTVLVNEGLGAMFGDETGGNCIISVRNGRVVRVRQTQNPARDRAA